MKPRNSVATIVAALAVAIAPLAQAWDGNVIGTVTWIDVTDGGSKGLRITLAGQPMCTSGPSWAYLNNTDSNYNTYVAALLMAKATGTQVRIYSTYVAGYCHIGYATFY